MSGKCCTSVSGKSDDMTRRDVVLLLDIRLTAVADVCSSFEDDVGLSTKGSDETL